MKKKLIFLLSMVALFFASTLTSYAVFSFVSDNTVVKNVFADPIKQNYDFFGSDYNSRSIYNVYFFPQPRYASAGAQNSSTVNLANIKPTQILNYNPNTKIPADQPKNPNSNLFTYEKNFSSHQEGITNKRNTYGQYGIYDGYFEDTINTPNYNKKHRVVSRSLTDDIIAEIGMPKTRMFDSNSSPGTNAFRFEFTGWTMSQTVALDLGYGGIGDYMLIETNTPLSVIDKIKSNGKIATTKELNDSINSKDETKKIKGIDGSYIGDGNVFLYPIFTNGKDYSSNKPIDKMVIEKTIGASTTQSYYSSLFIDKSIEEKNTAGDIINRYSIDPEFDGNSKTTGKQIGYSYVFRDIRLTEAEVNNQTKVKFSTMPLLRESWFGQPNWRDSNEPLPYKQLLKDKKDVSASSTANKVGELELFSKPGDYNVYVYVLNSTYNNRFGKTVQTEMDKYPMNLLDMTPVSNPARASSKIQGLQNKEITDAFFVDKTQYYSFLGSTWHIKMWIFVEEKVNYKIIGGNTSSFDFRSSHADICGQVDTTGKVFAAENVQFLNLSRKFTHKFNDGSTVSFNNGVFTVFKLSTNPRTPIDNNFKIECGTNVTFATTADYNGNPPPTLKDKLIKVSKDGYYQILCTIKPGNIIRVDAIRMDIGLFIAIYENESQVPVGQDGFLNIDPNISPLYLSSKRVGIPNFQSIILGDMLTQTTTFATGYDPTTFKYTKTVTLYDIVMDLKKQNKVLYDVVTRRPIIEAADPLMTRNRVFYIGPTPTK